MLGLDQPPLQYNGKRAIAIVKDAIGRMRYLLDTEESETAKSTLEDAIKFYQSTRLANWNEKVELLRKDKNSYDLSYI
jgi:hypothetical protein